MRTAWGVLVVSLVMATAASAAGPWASQVVAYDYDGDGNPANDGVTPITPFPTTYNNPQASLGAPARMAGAGSPWASVVSAFSGAWLDSEVVSIAAGGRLVVTFDTPILDEAAHPYGVDLIVFGNAAFTDADWPNGRMGNPAEIWQDPGIIEVSADGLDWRVVPGVWADTLFPTQGYRDGGPYDATAGSVPSDFLKPMNPALTLADFAGLTYGQILSLYDGSGGGTPVDIAAAGLSEARYVRITAPAGADYAVEVDALAIVPEPASCTLLAFAGAGLLLRRPGRSVRGY